MVVPWKRLTSLLKKQFISLIEEYNFPDKVAKICKVKGKSQSFKTTRIKEEEKITKITKPSKVLKLDLALRSPQIKGRPFKMFLSV